MPRRMLEQKLIEKGSRSISDADIVKVVDKSQEIQRRFGSAGPLQRFVDDGRLLISIVKDYWAGRYRQVPFGTIGAAVVTLLYVLNPLDLLPDVLPIIGAVDDAAVVAACMLLIEHDLRMYQTWLGSQKLLPKP
jgi:uncharacterized membrane protein YkvA (DUF1232 family)